MFNYFFITVWIEYNNKIYSKVLPELFNGCKTHVEKIYTPKEFREKRKDKEYGHAYKTIR